MGFNFPLIEENRSSPLSSEYQTPIPPPTTEYSTIKHMSQIKSILSFYSSMEIRMSLCLDGNQNIHLQILNTLHHTSGLIYLITRL